MMRVSRRKFLAGASAASAGLLLPGWLGRAAAQERSADASRWLVLIHLDGGNDGLNTVSPLSDGQVGLRTDYEAARGTQGIATGDLLPLGIDGASGSALGLHPAMQGILELYDRGDCAVVQGCGYPEPNLSHAASCRAWQSGYPILSRPDNNGWFGNAMVEMGFAGQHIPAVNLGGTIAPSFAQSRTNVLALESLEEFRFPYDFDRPEDDAARRECFAALCAESDTADSAVVEHCRTTGRTALTATEAFVRGYSEQRADWASAYRALGSSVATDLRDVASVIYGVRQGIPGMDSRYFQVTMPGFDTHSNQGSAVPGGRHYELLRQLSDAIRLFYFDCEDLGILDDLCIVVWSEFGRRVKQNGNGTDHGSLSPMLVLGGRVQGGLYGQHPVIALDRLEGGNMPYWQDHSKIGRATDFRDVYGTILKHWLSIPEETILSRILLPELPHADPNAFWLKGRHDFDLGFLDSL